MYVSVYVYVYVFVYVYVYVYVCVCVCVCVCDYLCLKQTAWALASVIVLLCILDNKYWVIP